MLNAPSRRRLSAQALFEPADAQESPFFWLTRRPPWLPEDPSLLTSEHFALDIEWGMKTGVIRRAPDVVSAEHHDLHSYRSLLTGENTRPLDPAVCKLIWICREHTPMPLVLDLGCGAGNALAECAMRRCNPHGVTLTPPAPHIVPAKFSVLDHMRRRDAARRMITARTAREVLAILNEGQEGHYPERMGMSIASAQQADSPYFHVADSPFFGRVYVGTYPQQIHLPLGVYDLAFDRSGALAYSVDAAQKTVAPGEVSPVAFDAFSKALTALADRGMLWVWNGARWASLCLQVMRQLGMQGRIIAQQECHGIVPDGHADLLVGRHSSPLMNEAKSGSPTVDYVPNLSGVIDDVTITNYTATIVARPT